MGRQWRKLLVAAPLLLAGYFGFIYGLDLAFHPWAYLRPGLLGHWRGNFETPHLGRVEVSYDFRHELYREEGPSLEGEVEHCSETAGRREGNLTGRPSWLGQEVSLHDASVYGEWGSPESLVCRKEGEGLRCTMDFRRPTTPQLEAIAKKAGIWRGERKPIEFLLRRAEGPLSCPGV